jgi:hypothetical protein
MQTVKLRDGWHSKVPKKSIKHKPRRQIFPVKNCVTTLKNKRGKIKCKKTGVFFGFFMTLFNTGSSAAHQILLVGGCRD